ncbi:uncharacterized protein hi_0077 [Phtheirospermum japonicum]|uniref:Uncharacterized protein hi_0077 n=1 Tax=Phtheirospermum japonicum TaxID=374723 RepID=A0A830DF60_9LAMI|nr:uncharacterized protein hi_0077 [Phtheirospermum japonicum]
MSSRTRAAEENLVEAALRVLNTADPCEKARIGDEVARKWLKDEIIRPYDASMDIPVPDRPARLDNVMLVSPSEMPKLGKAGSLQSRQAIVHSLVHTESWAIDLTWDIIARFGKQESMPREFFTDFVKVAQDEGRHFTLLAERLKELGSFYGALPAHDGLWDSATATSKDLLARLAIEHCVHEERESEETEKIGDTNNVHSEVIKKFHATVRAFFRGPLKPPFNEVARRAAGFETQWYEPLAVKDFPAE